jgi:predicted RNase H-like HicB family nuclease
MTVYVLENGELHKLWKINNPLTLPMKFTSSADGWIVAEFPSLPGCISQGKTLDEAVRNLAQAIQAVYEAQGMPTAPMQQEAI